MPWSVDSEWKNKNADARTGNEFPLKRFWDGSMVLQEKRSYYSSTSKGDSWDGLTRMPSRCLLVLECFILLPGKDLGQTQQMEILCSRDHLRKSLCHSGKAGDSGSGYFCLHCCPETEWMNAELELTPCGKMPYLIVRAHCVCHHFVCFFNLVWLLINTDVYDC